MSKFLSCGKVELIEGGVVDRPDLDRMAKDVAAGVFENMQRLARIAAGADVLQMPMDHPWMACRRWGKRVIVVNSGLPKTEARGWVAAAVATLVLDCSPQIAQLVAARILAPTLVVLDTVDRVGVNVHTIADELRITTSCALFRTAEATGLPACLWAHGQLWTRNGWCAEYADSAEYVEIGDEPERYGFILHRPTVQPAPRDARSSERPGST